MTDDKIWRLIRIFFYCSIPPVLLVLTVTLMYVMVNSTVLTNNFLIVLFQQSLPIFLCYGIIPCTLLKIFENVPLQKIGIKKNKFLWIDVLDILIITAFTGYLVVAGIFQSEERIWVFHYLFVAVSEEVLVRGIIVFELKELLKKRWLAILISAILFSVVFHSTDEVLLNVLYRIPFGLITGFLYEKTDSLMSSILFHWIYDVLLSV